MKLKILGTRGEIEPTARRHANHSGILIDKKFLFDLGEKSFLKYRPKYMFLTHLHPDHAYFVRKDTNKLQAIVYAPENYKKLNIKVLKKPKKIADYKITPIPTIHSLKVKSQAYLIEKGKQKLLYTGDMIWIEKKYHKFLKNLDLVITEASYLREGGLIRKDQKTGKIYGHTGIPNLMKLFSRFTNQILLVHFGSWFFKDIKASRKKLEKLAKHYQVTVHIGYDGMQINLNNFSNDKF